MTRQELYEQVWSQPMRTLAKSMGISDVALAKRCRIANIPVPPRGWWARKGAGKAVKVTLLPAPPFVLANYFPALEAVVETPESRDEKALADPPAFRDIAAVREEIGAAVKAIKLPATLTAPHPAVARLLRQDAERKPITGPRSYFPEPNSQKFTTPIQQRRLRILSSFLNEFERLGCKISGATHAGERFNINVGGHWIYVLFGIEGGPAPTCFHRDRKSPKASDRERLRFDLVEHDHRSPPLQIWREDETPLERQATEIVRGLLVRVEEDARRFRLQRHQWAREDHERKVVEARRAAEQAAIARAAREKATAVARIEALIGGAEALERAARIRRYVAAVQTACTESGSVAAPVDLARWADWALAEADRIDPVSSGAFLADLKF